MEFPFKNLKGNLALEADQPKAILNIETALQLQLSTFECNFLKPIWKKKKKKKLRSDFSFSSFDIDSFFLYHLTCPLS